MNQMQIQLGLFWEGEGIGQIKLIDTSMERQERIARNISKKSTEEKWALWDLKIF